MLLIFIVVYRFGRRREVSGVGAGSGRVASAVVAAGRVISGAGTAASGASRRPVVAAIRRTSAARRAASAWWKRFCASWNAASVSARRARSSNSASTAYVSGSPEMRPIPSEKGIHQASAIVQRRPRSLPGTSPQPNTSARQQRCMSINAWSTAGQRHGQRSGRPLRQWASQITGQQRLAAPTRRHQSRRRNRARRHVARPIETITYRATVKRHPATLPRPSHSPGSP